MKGAFKEQAERIVRSFNKLPKQNTSNTISDEIKDDYCHFFQDCFHLKDWIKNDDKLPQKAKDEVECFIEKSKYLKHIADIANASKHLKLTKHIRIDKDIDFEILCVYSGDKREEMMSIKSKNISFGGYTLPVQALQEWNKFLNKYNLGGFDIANRE